MTEPTLPGFGVEADVPEHLRDRISKCRSCGTPIIWAFTDKKTMPVDAVPSDRGNVAVVIRGGTVRALVGAGADVVGPRHLSHFVTCPQATKWRKR